MTGNGQLEYRMADAGKHRSANRPAWVTAPAARTSLGMVALCAALALASCHSSRTSSTPSTVNVSQDIELHPIAKGVWVHTTFLDLPGMGRVPANGLVVVDRDEALLVDLPWTDGLTATLCDWIAENLGATVKAVIPTHFHEDCMGGLAEAHRRGAVSYGLDRTIEIAKQKGLPVPRIPYQSRIAVRCGATLAIATYFGAGHTTDNVVVWLPRQRIVFAGCLVKSMNSNSLGNTADGDLGAYPLTLRRVQAAYRKAKIVVPGHGDWGGPELIEHTLELCRQEGSKPGGG